MSGFGIPSLLSAFGLALVCHFILISGFQFEDNQPIHKYGTQLKCYICNSRDTTNCADFFDNTTMMAQNCPDDGRNYSMCRKIIQEFYLDGAWERRYIRGCAVVGTVGAEGGRWCQERAGTRRVRVRYCHCNNKQACNSAQGIFKFDLFTSLISTSIASVILLTQRIYISYPA